MKDRILGGSSLILVGGVYGIFGVFVRLMDQYFDSYSQIIVRNFGLLVFILLLSLIFVKKISIKGSSPIKVILFGLSYTLEIVLFTYALLITPLGLGLVTYYLGCFVFSFIIGKLYFKEKTSKDKILALVIAFIGIIVIAIPSISGNIALGGVLMAISSGIFNTLANSLRKDLKEVNPVSILTIQGFFGVLISIILLFITQTTLKFVITPESLVLGIIFSLLLLICSFLILYGFRHFDLNLGTVFTSAEIVFASIFGLLIFQEIPQIYDIIGGGIIVLALIIPPMYEYLKLKNSKLLIN